MPELSPAALDGPIGAFVNEVAAHTEADPAALLISALVSVGVAAGPGREVIAGNRPQRARLFAMVVAESAKANRGLSWAVTGDLLAAIDPSLARERVLRGLGNGSALLDALAPAPTRVRSPGAMRERGVPDERLLVFEPGITRALSVAARPSSPLTWTLRNAWDGAPIDCVRRGRRVIVERHHVGVIAHATVDQIRSQLSLTDASVSLVNRFIYVVARRGKLHPDESDVPPELMRRHGLRLGEAIAAARATPGEMRRTPTADRRWRSIYEELADDDPDGLLGIVVARSARHVLRLALVYALADRSREIRPAHLEAAAALWRFSRASAAEILGAQQDDDIAGRLLDALRAAGPAGMSLTEQAHLFGRNLAAARLARARDQLERDGLAVTAVRRRGGSGRPPQVTRIVDRPD